MKGEPNGMLSMISFSAIFGKEASLKLNLDSDYLYPYSNPDLLVLDQPFSVYERLERPFLMLMFTRPQEVMVCAYYFIILFGMLSSLILLSCLKIFIIPLLWIESVELLLLLSLVLMVPTW